MPVSRSTVSKQYMAAKMAEKRQLKLKINNARPTVTKRAKPTSDATSGTTFLKLLENYDIRTEITNYLGSKDFQALAGCTFNLRQTLRAERWNINRKLARFVRDSISFRNLQARTNALISGPFALSFAEGKIWGDSYPVVWVHKEHQTEWMEFLAADGYVQQASPSATQRYDDQSRFDGAVVSTFNGSCQRQGYGSVELHVHFTGYNAFAALVHMTEMTCQCNFITWEKAYVMFARSTLLQHRTYPVNTHRLPELGAALKLLESIGWPVHDFAPRFDRYKEGDGIRRAPNRSPGDSHSLTVPLDTCGVSPGTMNYENCDFGIHGERPSFTMFTVALRHPLLRHDYASCMNDGGYTGKFAFLKEDKLDAILTFEMIKHDPSACPPGIPYPDLDDYFSLHRRNTCQEKSWQVQSGWEPPSGWKFVDEYLTQWIKDVDMSTRPVGMRGVYSP